MKRIILFSALLVVISCNKSNQAEIILTNAKIYTYSWSDPDGDGKTAADAPLNNGKLNPDAEAIVIASNKIVYVGSVEEALKYTSEQTEVIDLNGATVLPGMVDSHTHIAEIGKISETINLIDAKTEEEAVALIAEFAKTHPKGEWILASNWDEGAWANAYPDKKLLTEKVPEHPVFANSLHGFAAWANQMALDKVGITKDTKSPVGGEIVLGKDGEPNGLFMNNADELMKDAIPEPLETVKRHVLIGMEEMIRSGYTAVHYAGLTNDLFDAFDQLEKEGKLKLRIYGMIKATDETLVERSLKSGPDMNMDQLFTRRSVKAYYDAALGSRGARMLEDYSDRPGHRGVSGADYGFNVDVVKNLMAKGFQVGIHAIGDAGNRETLDIIEKIYSEYPESRKNRHRVEHAQIIHPDDLKRLKELDLIASMQPPHAVEDKAWVEERIGKHRLKGAYAWRSLRQLGVPIVFGSDLSGSDHNIFYGLHSATTRRSKDLQPTEGWTIDESLSMEESIRAYSLWAAESSFMEDYVGALETGKWADITVMSIDPHHLEKPEDLFAGEIVMTIVNGEIVYRNN